MQVLAALQSLVDLAGLFRVWNPRFRSWSVWSQVGIAASRTRMCCPVLHRAAGHGQSSDRPSSCNRTTCASSCWGGTRRGRRTTRPSTPPRACGCTTCTTTCSRTRRPGSGRRWAPADRVMAAVIPESVAELHASHAVKVLAPRSEGTSLPSQAPAVLRWGHALHCRRHCWQAPQPRPSQRQTPHSRASAKGTARHVSAVTPSSHEWGCRMQRMSEIGNLLLALSSRLISSCEVDTVSIYGSQLCCVQI